MKGKAVSGLMQILLLVSTLTLTFYVKPIKSDYTWTETIYIRADGSIEPDVAPISSADNIIYTLTDNIVGDVTGGSSAIVIERDNIVIDGASYILQGAGNGTGIELTGRSNVIIENMEIKSFSIGIYLRFSSNNHFTGNNIRNNLATVGIFMRDSSNNTVLGNNITDNGSGILIIGYPSGNNVINGNNITNNEIWIAAGSNHIVANNNFVNCGLVVTDYHSYGNHVENNLVNGKLLVYLEGLSGYTVENAGQVILNDCTGIRVENLDLSNASVGVELLGTNNTIIAGNNIANNGNGIRLEESSNNSILANNITENDYGVLVQRSSTNTFYHNNFVDNTQPIYDISWEHPSISPSENAWDDGYPSGGNYWNNYGNVDLYGGSYQNETGSDGIGDAPYVIDANNTDFYPLMNPWILPDVAVTNVTTSKTGCLPMPTVGQGYNAIVKATIQNQGRYPETFNVTAYANTILIDTQTNIILASGDNTTLTFTWNTTGFAYGNYTINANATIVQGETNTADNTYTNGKILVTIPGDADGNRKVDVIDQRMLQLKHFWESDLPGWNPNVDVDGNLRTDVLDQRIQQLHMFETW